jgi:hypothetical protein
MLQQELQYVQDYQRSGGDRHCKAYTAVSLHHSAIPSPTVLLLCYCAIVLLCYRANWLIAYACPRFHQRLSTIGPPHSQPGELTARTTVGSCSCTGRYHYRVIMILLVLSINHILIKYCLYFLSWWAARASYGPAAARPSGYSQHGCRHCKSSQYDLIVVCLTIVGFIYMYCRIESWALWRRALLLCGA